MKAKTIAEIKQLLNQNDLTKEEIEKLRLDSRKGVQTLLDSYDRRLEAKAQLKNKFDAMWKEEESLAQKGFKFIAGTDEAGRGPLAGPVVAASVILPKSFNILGITDSKQLSEKEREYFFHRIKEESVAYSIYSIDNKIIDKINILEATKKCMERSLLQLKEKPDYVLIDAVHLKHFPIPNKSLIKGDERSISIAAASILAKVYRDQKMLEIAEEFPGYGFESHKGYGTREHIAALKKLGPTPYHRMSFTPVKNNMG